MKTLRKVFKQDKEKFSIPKSVQNAIPIQTVYPDGIFLVGNGKYSKTFIFDDINYAAASIEEKKDIFFKYSELLNSFDNGATYKITIIVKRIDMEEFGRSVLIPLGEKSDGLDKYRNEYNHILTAETTGASGYVQKKYITVSVVKKNIEEARNFFSRVAADLSGHFANLGSKAVVLNAHDRLKIFHDFFRQGEESAFFYDIADAARKGHSFKDFICPDALEFHKDHFIMHSNKGAKYGTIAFLRTYANYIKDEMVSEICGFNQNMAMSIDVISVPTDEAVGDVQKSVLGVETNIANWQRKQNNANNYSASVPYQMEQDRKDANETLDDLTTRDQRMFYGILTVVLTADSKEELDNDKETLFSIGRKYSCSMSTLTFQQIEGLNTVLPYGLRKIDAVRSLTTESLAVFTPFRVQEVFDKGGVYYGLNAISRNMIVCDKKELQNPNAFRLGVPGSGKSFGAKEEIIFLAIATDDDILVGDPEGEYGKLLQALGGQVIQIAAGSHDHINALDMFDGYGDGTRDPIFDKSEFVLSLFEQLDPHNRLTVIEKGIIDNCVRNVYENHKDGGEMPTLRDLQNELKNHQDKEAAALARSLELFTNGSLNVFAHKTNVNTQNRLMVYDISRLGSQLKTMGLLVITDAIINRVSENWKRAKRTHVYIDEFHVVFENEYSGKFFASAWRQFRKRDAYPTALTQNVEYLLDNIDARTMLSNSELIVMNNQAASDRAKLAELLNISPQQMSYVTNAEVGSGLMRIGKAIVPFVNKINPATTSPLLYSLMTTRAGEWGGNPQNKSKERGSDKS